MDKQKLKANKIKLIQQLEDLVTTYNEKITSLIFSSLKLSSWETTFENTLNLIYEDLEKVYISTLAFLKENYDIKDDSPVFISDFKTLTYHADGLDIEQRVKRKIEFYQQQELELKKEIIPYDFDRILRTENKNFCFNLEKQKIKKYFPEDLLYADVWGDPDDNGYGENCADYYGEMIPEDEVEEPPFHPNCDCNIIWYTVPPDEIQYL